MSLDKVNRSTKLNAAVKVDGAWHRLRVGLAPLGPVLQPEGQLEMPGHVAGVVLACPPQPFSEIGADRSDAILPYTVDGRRKVIPIPGGDFRNDRFELLPRPVEIVWPHREQVLFLETREQLELDVVDERPALQRVESIDRLRHLARSEADEWPGGRSDRDSEHSSEERSANSSGRRACASP